MVTFIIIVTDNGIKTTVSLIIYIFPAREY